MHLPIYIHHRGECDSEVFVYFSLPFYPVKQKTYFYHGHMSLGLDDHIYQIYNPRMLKSDFILSVMPAKFWFYDSIRNWVDRDCASPTYGYVSLYSTCETERTRVFYIRFTDIKKSSLEKYKNHLICLNDQYKNKEIDFSILENNCVSIIRSIFYEEGILKKNFLDLFPFITFKKILKNSIKQNRKFEVGIVNGKMNGKFKLHRFCIGLLTLSPEKHILKLIEKLTTRLSSGSS